MLIPILKTAFTPIFNSLSDTFAQNTATILGRYFTSLDATAQSYIEFPDPITFEANEDFEIEVLIAKPQHPTETARLFDGVTSSNRFDCTISAPDNRIVDRVYYSCYVDGVLNAPLLDNVLQTVVLKRDASHSGQSALEIGNINSRYDGGFNSFHDMTIAGLKIWKGGDRLSGQLIVDMPFDRQYSSIDNLLFNDALPKINLAQQNRISVDADPSTYENFALVPATLDSTKIYSYRMHVDRVEGTYRLRAGDTITSFSSKNGWISGTFSPTTNTFIYFQSNTNTGAFKGTVSNIEICEVTHPVGILHNVATDDSKQFSYDDFYGWVGENLTPDLSYTFDNYTTQWTSPANALSNLEDDKYYIYDTSAEIKTGLLRFRKGVGRYTQHEAPFRIRNQGLLNTSIADYRLDWQVASTEPVNGSVDAFAVAEVMQATEERAGRYLTEFDKLSSQAIYLTGNIELSTKTVIQCQVLPKGVYADAGILSLNKADIENINIKLENESGINVVKVATNGHTPLKGVVEIPVGKLSTILVEIDHATGDGNVYVNGNLDYSFTHEDPSVLDGTYLNNGVGYRQEVGGEHFDGIIADVKIWIGGDRDTGTLALDMPIDENCSPVSTLVNNRSTSIENLALASNYSFSPSFNEQTNIGPSIGIGEKWAYSCDIEVLEGTGGGFRNGSQLVRPVSESGNYSGIFEASQAGTFAIQVYAGSIVNISNLKIFPADSVILGNFVNPSSDNSTWYEPSGVNWLGDELSTETSAVKDSSTALTVDLGTLEIATYYISFTYTNNDSAPWIMLGTSSYSANSDYLVGQLGSEVTDGTIKFLFDLESEPVSNVLTIFGSASRCELSNITIKKVLEQA